MTDPFALFTDYYKKKFSPGLILIPDLKFRHFRFQPFSGEKRYFRLKDIIQSKDQLFQTILDIIPLNAYFTPTRWLNPIYLAKTKCETDIILFSALYFDVDSEALNPLSFEQTKITTQRLIDQINQKYKKKPDLVVFSGRRGFHVYYWNWDSKLCHMPPQDRINSFVAERKKILKDLRINGIVVDERVTIDPYRIMRIPNTLHGKTGLVARKVTDLKKFDPINEALAFDLEEYRKVMKINLLECFSEGK
jgi:DNA primase catalytic subunit